MSYVVRQGSIAFQLISWRFSFRLFLFCREKEWDGDDGGGG